MDEAPSGPWTVDPATLTALRLEKAKEAIRGGDATTALIEAEELLNTPPIHDEALFLVAEAALTLGDATMAKSAFQQFLLEEPEHPPALTGLSVALFETAEIAESLAASQRAAELAPDTPEAWHYIGLALERSDRPDEAALAFQKAHEMRPGMFPLKIDISDEEWEQAVEDGKRGLPGPIRAFYAKIPVVWESFPTVDDLHHGPLPLSPLTDALYVGKAPEEADPWIHSPQKVRLFRGNLGYPPVDADGLSQRITRALFHEAIDWLGIREADIWPIS